MNDLGKRKRLARSVSRFIWIIFVIVSLGCLPGTDAVPPATVTPTPPVSSATVTATTRPSLTPSPTAIPFPVEVVNLGMGEIEISSEFMNLPPGTYLMYVNHQTQIGEEKKVIRYMSLDGILNGQVATVTADEFRVSAVFVYLTYREVDGRPTVYMTETNHLDQTTIMRLGLTTGETQTWRIEPGLDIECDVSWESPDGRWLPFDCFWRGKHSIYLMNLETGAGTELSPRGYECRGYGWEFTWTPDNQLLSWCRVGYDRATECLVSPQNGGYQCQTGDFDRVLSMSPSGNMAAFYSHSDVLDERYIYFDDAACLQNRQTCAETFRICDGPDSCDYAWDRTGENLVIVRTRSSNLREFYTYVSLFNIAEHSSEELVSGQPGSWLLEGFSPDNRWVVFNAGDVALFSLDSHLLRRTPTEGGFLGWYVVP